MGTKIRLDLLTPSNAALKIYDMLGREVRTLMDLAVEAGYRSVRWDGRDNNGEAVSSRIYVYRIQAGSFSAAKKCVVMK